MRGDWPYSLTPLAPAKALVSTTCSAPQSLAIACRPGNPSLDCPLAGTKRHRRFVSFRLALQRRSVRAASHCDAQPSRRPRDENRGFFRVRSISGRGVEVWTGRSGRSGWSSRSPEPSPLGCPPRERGHRLPAPGWSNEVHRSVCRPEPPAADAGDAVPPRPWRDGARKKELAGGVDARSERPIIPRPPWWLALRGMAPGTAL